MLLFSDGHEIAQSAKIHNQTLSNATRSASLPMAQHPARFVGLCPAAIPRPTSVQSVRNVAQPIGECGCLLERQRFEAHDECWYRIVRQAGEVSDSPTATMPTTAPPASRRDHSAIWRTLGFLRRWTGDGAGATKDRGGKVMVVLLGMKIQVVGRVTMKRAPVGWFVSARTVPPWRSTIHRTMARPRPVPVLELSAR